MVATSRRDVPETRAQRSEQRAERYAVDADQDEPGNDDQGLPARPQAGEHDDDDTDKRVMGEEDQVPPHHLIDIDAEWRSELLDDGAIGDEYVGALDHEIRDQLPGDEPEGEIRQIVLGVAADERHIDEAQPRDEGAEADGDPKRPKQRTAVSLPDVVPTGRDPELPVVAPALPEIPQAPGKRNSVHEALPQRGRRPAGPRAACLLRSPSSPPWWGPLPPLLSKAFQGRLLTRGQTLGQKA
jgi:hypothetical protein